MKEQYLKEITDRLTVCNDLILLDLILQLLKKRSQKLSDSPELGVVQLAEALDQR